jgi:hypothetical protein
LKSASKREKGSLLITGRKPWKGDYLLNLPNIPSKGALKDEDYRMKENITPKSAARAVSRLLDFLVTFVN